MAVTTFSVTVQMVERRLGLGEITATTRPLSTSDVEQFIEQAAAEMAGALQNAGYTFADLNDNDTASVQQAVIAGAVYYCLTSIGGMSQQRLQSARQDWESSRDLKFNRPARLQQRDTSSISNIDTSRDRPIEFGGTGYEF